MSIANDSPSVAAAPFDDTSADIVIRSCDGVDFYVDFRILRVSSDIFKAIYDMVSSGSERARGLPSDFAVADSGKVIWNVEEVSDVWDPLLRLIFPIIPPELEDLTSLAKVIDTAKKYDVPGVLFRLQKELGSFCHSDPLRVYAIAHRNSMDSISRTAAQAFGAMPDEYAPELELIDAGAYHNLLEYHKGGRQGPIAIAAHASFCTRRYTLRANTSLTSGDDGANLSSSIASDFDLPHADITIRSSDGIDFRVHNYILGLALEAFGNMLEASSPSEDPIPVDEPGHVWDSLLRFCYSHLSSRALPDSTTVIWVLKAAQKYLAVDSVLDTVKDRYQRVLDADPFSAYAVICQMKSAMDMEQEARAAARASLHLPMAFPAPMENITAGDYFRLLKYHERVREPLLQMLFDSGPIYSESLNFPNLATGSYNSPSLYYSPGRCYGGDWKRNFVTSLRTHLLSNIEIKSQYSLTEIITAPTAPSVAEGYGHTRCGQKQCPVHAILFAMHSALEAVQKELDLSIATVDLEWQAA